MRSSSAAMRARATLPGKPCKAAWYERFWRAVRSGSIARCWNTTPMLERAAELCLRTSCPNTAIVPCCAL